MEKQILNFTVNEQILVCENPIRISTNKVNYIEAHFDLGTNWSGYDSIRAIWFNDFNCISTVLDSLGNCVVPFEVMKRKGNVKVNLVGSISEDDVLTDRLTSYPVVAVIVDCTAQITGANTSPITPSEFEQFAQRVHTDADRAEQGASNAETSAQNAHTSEQNASQSAQSAHDDKIAIEEAIAEVIQQIEDFEQVQVVVNTLPPSSPATSDFTDGVLTLGIPQGVKGDTGNGIQSIRKTGTSGLVDTYTITYTDGQTTTFTVTNGAKGDTGNGISTIEKTSTVGLVDTYTITYTNGTTTTFTVTNGEKGDKGDTGEVSLQELEDATVVQTLSDNEPYHFRRTNNGNGSGTREYDEIVGASVGWNQLFPFDNDSWHINTMSVSVSNGRFVLSGTANVNGTSALLPNRIYNQIKPIYGHKYLLVLSGTHDFSEFRFLIYGATAKSVNISSPATSKIFKCTVQNVTDAEFVATYTGGTTYSADLNTMLIDLTLFNSQIADYVYSLEQSTSGAGVTWLRNHFPKLFDTYQPFDSGSIKSVSGLTAHEMVGKNLWNTDDISSISVGTINRNGCYFRLSGQYTVSAQNNADYMCCRVFNADGSTKNTYNIVSTSTITNATFTISDGEYFAVYDAVEATIATSTVRFNNWKCQVEFGSTATSYEPYTKHTYPLDSSVTLRGQYKLDANNNLYAVGDVWSSDGNIAVNWSDEIDLKPLDWTYASGRSFFFADLSPLPKSYGACVTNLYPFCPTASWNDRDKYFSLGGVGAYNNSIIVKDTSLNGDVNALKTKLEGAKCIYALATPTTETTPTYENPQWCDSHGTEEYVGSELPVGHNTDYPMTMIDCADGLGNGTYTPKLTVTNGKLTFEWQSV